MIYPLVRDLADDGIPVTVTCRVLKIARQPYYRWLAAPVTDAEFDEAHLANAVFDAHRDDPEFGYRFLADEVRQAGHEVCDRTVWRISRDNGWWSAFGKPKRRKGRPPGTPAHDDLVRRNFTADAPNELWLADITEHPTTEGKLYLCAIKDAFSNRIVGWSIDSRMKARLVVAAIEMAVARRGRNRHRDRHLDRTHLPPAPPPSRPRAPHAHRIRDDQHPTGHPGRLTQIRPVPAPVVGGRLPRPTPRRSALASPDAHGGARTGHLQR